MRELQAQAGLPHRKSQPIGAASPPDTRNAAPSACAPTDPRLGLSIFATASTNLGHTTPQKAATPKSPDNATVGSPVSMSIGTASSHSSSPISPELSPTAAPLPIPRPVAQSLTSPRRYSDPPQPSRSIVDQVIDLRSPVRQQPHSLSVHKGDVHVSYSWCREGGAGGEIDLVSYSWNTHKAGTQWQQKGGYRFCLSFCHLLSTALTL